MDGAGALASIRRAAGDRRRATHPRRLQTAVPRPFRGARARRPTPFRRSEPECPESATAARDYLRSRRPRRPLASVPRRALWLAPSLPTGRFLTWSAEYVTADHSDDAIHLAFGPIVIGGKIEGTLIDGVAHGVVRLSFEHRKHA